jgi:hypothetical protein
MKLPFFSRPKQLSEDEIKAAMDELRKLRVDVAVTEVEAELRRSHQNVLVLRPKRIGAFQSSPSRKNNHDDRGSH